MPPNRGSIVSAATVAHLRFRIPGEPTMEKEAGKVWIGVDIGGTKTAVVLSSEPPAMLARIEFATLPGQGPDRANLLSATSALVAEARWIRQPA